MRFSKVLLAVFCLALIPAFASAVQLNEMRVDQSGSDYDEYVELSGTPGESLDGVTYVVIGDGTGGSGVVETAVDLTGYVIAADGYFLMVEGDLWTDTCGDFPDLEDNSNYLNLENSDNNTHLLVTGFTGAINDDIDTDDDGVIDNLIWSSVVDCIALVETPGSGELVYCDETVGPDGFYAVAHAVKCETFWMVGEYDLCVDDTPGMSNVDACAVSTEETTFGSLKALYR